MECDREILECAGISVAFGGFQALDNVELTCRRGEIAGLIGPNGAGKTTLINVISGFQKSAAGSIRLSGRNISRVPASKLSALGLSRTFQGGRLFERMTVFENVLAASLLTGVNRAEAAKRANSLLDQFDLLHRSSTMASELPYGEERLLSIARSLASQPTFLLLDEPAAGLNENETHRLKEKLGRIPGEFGCGMLIVEHDMDLIMGICENVWVLANGKNLAHGLPEAVSSDKNVIREYLGEGLIDAA